MCHRLDNDDDRLITLVDDCFLMRVYLCIPAQSDILAEDSEAGALTLNEAGTSFFLSVYIYVKADMLSIEIILDMQ